MYGFGFWTLRFIFFGVRFFWSIAKNNFYMFFTAYQIFQKTDFWFALSCQYLLVPTTVNVIQGVATSHTRSKEQLGIPNNGQNRNSVISSEVFMHSHNNLCVGTCSHDLFGQKMCTMDTFRQKEWCKTLTVVKLRYSAACFEGEMTKQSLSTT